MGSSGVPGMLMVAKLTFDNGVDWAAFLTESTVDALCHINVVSCGSSASIFTFFRLDCDCLGWADSFAQLAGDAPLFTSGIAAQSMLATKPRRYWPLLKWIVNGIAAKVSDRSLFLK